MLRFYVSFAVTVKMIGSNRIRQHNEKEESQHTLTP